MQEAYPKPTLDKARTAFLVRSVDRLLSSERLSPPNPHCSICGVAHVRVQIDLSRATLRHFVEGLLKEKLGYTDEVAVSTDAGVIYDPDLDDNLDKRLSDLGVSKDGTITVTDEEDVDARVNLVLNVKDESPPAEESPIRLLEKYEVKRKPPKPAEEALAIAKDVATLNGNGHPVHANGVKDDKATIDLEPASGSKRKRGADEADLEADIARKRGKVMEERPRELETNGVKGEADAHGAVMVVDEGDGAIVIDD